MILPFGFSVKKIKQIPTTVCPAKYTSKVNCKPHATEAPYLNKGLERDLKQSDSSFEDGWFLVRKYNRPAPGVPRPLTLSDKLHFLSRPSHPISKRLCPLTSTHWNRAQQDVCDGFCPHFSESAWSRLGAE